MIWTQCYFWHIRELIPLLVFYFRVEEKFAGGKCREIPCAVDIYFTGVKFRAKSKFANIANVSSKLKICIIQYVIRKCRDRLCTWICLPLAQSVYQSGRSTTEQVFAIKVLAEKCITSSTYNIYLLLDMSKAFDTVCGSKLLGPVDLQEILEPDEMHMVSILNSDVVLKMNVGKEVGEHIKTQVGIAQGDWLSAVLFVIYLAKSFTHNSECMEHN